MTGRSEDQTLTDGGQVGRAPALQEGASVGRYVIEGRLGAGGMGVVYAARDPELDRPVALKLLHARPHDARADGARAQSRLLREAQALARLSHRNVVTVHDVGEHDGRIFVAMELVAGMTLRQWQDHKDPSQAQTVAVFIAAGRGLAAAHAAGLVHRDFKPDNVMVTFDARGSVARVLVMDFGLARSSASQGPVEPPRSASGLMTDESGSQDVTRSGGLRGTPAYMSPEQHLGAAVDPRSDQFSYCVALYEALARQRPFEGDNAVALAFAVIEGAVRPWPPQPEIPRWLSRAVLRGLHARPEARWPTMDALLHQLSRGRGRWRRGAVLGTLVASVGIAAVLPWHGADPCAAVGESIGATWSGQARADVRGILLGGGADASESAWTTLGGQLDTYAADWSAARQQACRQAPNQEPELAVLRLACLQERRRRFEAVVAVLRQPHANAVADTASPVDALPALASCADAAFLLAQVEPPADPALAAQVEDLRGVLSRVEALEDAGRYREANDAGAPALARARALGYAPAVAQAARAVGSARLALGDVASASALLQEAYLTASAAGDNAVAAQAALDLAYAYGVGSKDPAQGRLWIEHARTQVERLVHPEPMRRALRMTEATVAWAEDRYQDAVVAATEALAMAEREAGQDSRVVARLLQNLGLYETKAGHPQRGKVHLERSVAILEAQLGPDHPMLAQALANMGIALSHIDEPEAALQAYQRALKIRERALGSDHREVGTLVQNIAIVHAEQGRNAQALPMFERAQAIREASLAADHPEVGSGHMNLAVSLGIAGRNVDALDHLRRALDIAVAAGEVDSPLIGMIHFESGNRRKALGQLDEAIADYRTARTILAKALGAEHPNLVIANAALAEALEAQGQLDEALVAYEAALSLGEAVGLRESELALVRIGVATLRWRLLPAQRAAAVAMVQRSVGTLPPGHETRVQAEAWLSERVAATP